VGVAGVIVALAVQALLVALLTWPLPARVTTELPYTPRGFDSLLLGWALAHETRALTDPAVSFADGSAFHPSPRSLLYGEAAFAALPLFAPSFLATGNPTLALDVTLLGGLLLTAASLHVVAVALTASQGAGCVAGLVFLATPWVHRVWAPAAPNYALLAFLPWIVLATAEPRAPRSWRAALVLLVLIVAQGLVSAYVAAAVLAPLLLLAVCRLPRARSRAGGARMLAVTLAAATVLAAVYSMHLAVRGLVPDPGNTFWATSFLPPIDLPLGLRSPDLPLAVPSAALLVIVLGGLALLLGPDARRDGLGRRGWSAAAFWVATGILISLPPRTTVLGRFVPLPQALLAQWTPLFDLFREVYRLGLAALIGLALLTGLAFAQCAAWVSSRTGWRSGIVAGALLVVAAGGILAPISSDLLAFPTHAPLVGEPVTMAALRRGRGPVLDLPLHPPLGIPWEQAEAMYRSIFHGRPVLNGYSGYWPPEFPRHMALAQAVPDGAAIAELRRRTGLATVVINIGGYERFLEAFCQGADRVRSVAVACDRLRLEADAKRRAWIALAESGGNADLRLVARSGDEMVFEVVGGGSSAPATSDVPAGAEPAPLASRRATSLRR